MSYKLLDVELLTAGANECVIGISEDTGPGTLEGTGLEEITAGLFKIGPAECGLCLVPIVYWE